MDTLLLGLGKKFLAAIVVFATQSVFLGLGWLNEGNWKDLTIFLLGFLFAANVGEKFVANKVAVPPAVSTPPAPPAQAGESLGLPPVP